MRESNLCLMRRRRTWEEKTELLNSGVNAQKWGLIINM